MNPRGVRTDRHPDSRRGLRRRVGTPAAANRQDLPVVLRDLPHPDRHHLSGRAEGATRTPRRHEPRTSIPAIDRSENGRQARRCACQFRPITDRGSDSPPRARPNRAARERRHRPRRPRQRVVSPQSLRPTLSRDITARREERRPGPDRQAVLVDHWRVVIATLGDPASLVIGGKSMGRRMWSLIADETGVGRLVYLGYPFHPRASRTASGRSISPRL